MSRSPLSPGEIRDIRARAANGEPRQVIADAYGVSRTTIQNHLGAVRATDPLLTLVREDQPWARDAICTQTDPEAFFPEKGGSTREAKAVCKKCTVRAECLDYALDNDEHFGIWGGMSERDRRKLKRIIEGGGDVDEPEADAS